MPNGVGVPATAHTSGAGQEHPGSGGRGTAGTRALGVGGQGCLQLCQRHSQAQGLEGRRPSPQGSLLEKSVGWGGGGKGRWGGRSVSEPRTGPRVITLLSRRCHYPLSRLLLLRVCQRCPTGWGCPQLGHRWGSPGSPLNRGHKAGERASGSPGCHLLDPNAPTPSPWDGRVVGPLHPSPVSALSRRRETTGWTRTFHFE